jgi:hypothetical protein
MYGDWNPQAYLQAQSNADLERQYRESEYGRQQALTREAELKNVYSEQDQPLLLEQKRLTNQNLGYTGLGQQATNRKLGVEADLAEGTKQFKLDDAKRKELAAVKDHDLAMADKMVEQLRRSLDPKENEMGEKLFQLTGIARAEKQKQVDAMELERYKQMQETGRWLERNQTSLEAAGINQAGQDRRATAKASAGGGVDFWTTFNSKLRTARDKHAALIAEATRLGDTPEAQVMLNMAEAIRPQAMAEIATVKPGSINAGEVAGMPVNPAPQIAPKGRESSGRVAPAVGTVKDGYVFMGGNPADKNSWRKQ